MVGHVTYGKRQFEAVDETFRQLLPTLHDAMINSIPMIDVDTDAFNDYMVRTFRLNRPLRNCIN